MNLPTVMTSKDFYKLLPVGWDDDTDNDGQIVIYTGLMWNDSDNLASFADYVEAMPYDHFDE